MELGIYSVDNVEVANVMLDKDSFMFWSNDKALETFLQNVQDNGLLVIDGTGIDENGEERLLSKAIFINEKTYMELLNVLNSSGYNVLQRR